MVYQYGFGAFETLCRTIPSYPHCNLFFRQLQRDDPSLLSGDLSTAGVGVNPECAIPKEGHGNLGNIGNIITCGLSVFVIAFLMLRVTRRKAAVGLIEFRSFLLLYLLSCIFQLLDTGSLFRQGSTALVILTAIHLGLVAALGWALLFNGFVSLQWVEDGTISSMVPFWAGTAAFFVATLYISLDTALGWTKAFAPGNPTVALKNIPLFVLTTVWPAAAIVIYFLIMIIVIVRILREKRPLTFFIAAFILFAIAQVMYFEVSKFICKSSKSKVDGSLIATVFETASVFTLFLGWKSITEDSWDEPWYGN
ncbi:hypothetical protein FRB96_003805 [Tulasnella sp. 330]|nr:hypothetical protein FRB96_003805 [Tulasnella sp. 330]KAG8877358.1 hypothetical protein FRB97_003471 [Tulasnella sp. 331]KAG8882680.1 hypothetical protein FRB98_003538 [Tulasnella sp. 332]